MLVAAGHVRGGGRGNQPLPALPGRGSPGGRRGVTAATAPGDTRNGAPRACADLRRVARAGFGATPPSRTARLKGVSSRRLRQEYPELVRHYWRAQRLWSGSCFAGSVCGAPPSIGRQYIEQQNRLL
ncbi:transposase [Streptomyces sp. x-80]|uniref:transposase n=1 Tax=Streptomyces sp. x-80 TaxID=2789282 RepID=UPI00397FB8A5